jgi:molybdopterin-guanine dinucleotide biosynthesis protein A
MTGIAGILLTGGRSRRLGIDKATLVLGGETLAARGARLLGAVCAGPLVEAGDGVSGLPAVRESPAGSGPLAGLAAAGAALRSRGHHGAALVLGVDLPGVDEALLGFLRDWPGEPTALPEVDGRPQYVCARYGGDALLAAQSLVTGGVRALRDLLDVVDHELLGASVWGRHAAPDAFVDLDTPADAAHWGIERSG